MAEIVRMPKLSDTMVEGVVAEWHKKEGDSVESGELLAEIETDKATMEFESFQEGVLLHIGVQKGQTAPVDSILAILGEKGEDISELLAEESNKKDESTEEQKEEPKKEESKSTPNPAPVNEKKETPKKETTKTTSTKSYPSAAESGSDRIFASPLAKKLAEERHINLNFVRGTGEG